ncbi:MAG TPA: ATP-binding protein [Gemmatimonadales bacterium]|nr:ATP-binding protein [Gemmatimonadales bacterium]
MIPADLMVMANRAAVLRTVLRWLLHDMRNPVQVLCLLPELSAGGGESMEAGGSRDSIAQLSDRLSLDLALFDRLLRSPPEPGRARPTAVGDSVRFIDELVSRSRAPASVDTSVALAAVLPAAATTEEHLDHALLNLVLNALEAQSEQATRIAVGADIDGGMLRIWVQDDGPGIAPSVRSGLLTGPLSTKSGHAGLGLLVTQHLARACGGDLRLGEVSTGTRVDLLLPAWARTPEG